MKLQKERQAGSELIIEFLLNRCDAERLYCEALNELSMAQIPQFSTS